MSMRVCRACTDSLVIYQFVSCIYKRNANKNAHTKIKINIVHHFSKGDEEEEDDEEMNDSNDEDRHDGPPDDGGGGGGNRGAGSEQINKDVEELDEEDILSDSNQTSKANKVKSGRVLAKKKNFV